MLESYTLSDLVSQRLRFVVTNYEQVYREMNHFFVLKIFLDSTKLKIVWIKITTFFKRRVSIML